MAAPSTIEYATSPSSSTSSPPVTVTVWGMFQLAAVKVSEATETAPSVGSELERLIVTSAVGCEVRTTVKVAAPPASVMASPDVGVTVMPAVSSSAFVTLTSAGSRPGR